MWIHGWSTKVELAAVDNEEGDNSSRKEIKTRSDGTAKLFLIAGLVSIPLRMGTASEGESDLIHNQR